MNAERVASGTSPFCRDSSRPASVLVLAAFLVVFAAGCGRVDMGPASHFDGGSEDTGVSLVDASGADLGDLGTVLDAENELDASATLDAIVEPLDDASSPDAAACAEDDPECEEPLEDVDECAGGTDECEPEATCVNTYGSYLCTCPMSGFVATGRGCADVDECISGAASCVLNSTCQNTPGAYECVCDAGFVLGIGGACVNTDECLLEMDDCGAHSVCRDTSPGYVCDCDPGYAPDPGGGHFCVNVNECDTDNGGCGDGIECADSDGSYSCGGCLRGFAPDPVDPESCVDIDECSLSTYPCDVNADCVNEPGAFRCACAEGYEGPGTSCSNLNECALGGYCSPLVTCADSPGSYACGACPVGYSGDGSTCTDVDECETAVCERGTTCENTPGGYRCGCPEGFIGDDFSGCVPRPLEFAGGLGFACARFYDGEVYCWGLGALGQRGNGTEAFAEGFTAPTSPVVGFGEAAEQIVAGSAFACARLSSGKVRCWGADDRGQLGNDAALVSQGASVEVLGITNAVEISAHSEHACARLSDGSIKCWGANSSGQLGDGSTTDRPTPVTALGLTATLGLTTSTGHTCAILSTNRRVLCWGSNAAGQLGDDAEANRSTPGNPNTYSVYDGFNEVRNAVALASTTESSCALINDGRVQCWGGSSRGELGRALFAGAAFDRLAGPVTDLSDATSLVGATTNLGRTFCAARTSGPVTCWGHGSVYVRGDGLTTSGTATAPIRSTVVDLASPASIALSHGAGFAVLPSGGVRSWGSPYGGVLGNAFAGTSTTSATLAHPGARPMASVYDATAITTSTGSACALRRDGRVLCWGYGAHGRLGNGSTSSRQAPVEVAGITNAVALTSYLYGHCAVLANRTVRCWGLNHFYMVDGGALPGASISTPREVAGLSDVEQLATGANHGCARNGAGEVWCWGRNANGQLGRGTITSATGVHPGDGSATSYFGLATPEKAALPAGRRAVDITAGYYSTCALLDNGEVWCWGHNNDALTRYLGVVNAGGAPITSASVTTPSKVAAFPFAGEVVVELESKFYNTCARFASGRAACWGINGSFGLLGRGDTTTASFPDAAYVRDGAGAPLEGVASIDPGIMSMCVLLDDGTTRCWGDNRLGQLGTGAATAPISTPSPTVGITNAIAISGRFDSGYCEPFGCALLADHSVRCWGRNRFGALGAGFLNGPGVERSTACGGTSSTVLDPAAPYFTSVQTVSSVWRE